MANPDVLLASGADDEAVARLLEDSIAAAGYTVERLGADLPGAGAARLGLVLVTRGWSRGAGPNRAIEAFATAGIRGLLVWWDEDAPSDFLSDRAAEDEVFYACFLPVGQRPPALVERLHAELGPGSGRI